MSTRRRYGLGIALLLCGMSGSVWGQAPQPKGSASPPVLSQSSIEQGRARFNRGVEYFREGDYRAALVEFQRAYEVAPHYRLLYNLAQTSLELQDYPAALRVFERYLAEGGQEIPVGRRTEVEREIQKLQGRVARVTISTNLGGAEILIDDVPVGWEPLSSPVIVGPGRRKITAMKAGSAPVSRFVDVASGDSATVVIELTEPVYNAAAPSSSAVPIGSVTAPHPRPVSHPTSRGPSDPHGQSHVGVWIGLATTGVLATGAAVVGILAVGAKNDYDSSLEVFPANERDIEAARNRTRNLALATDILTGAAVLSGGITLYVALSRKPSSSPTTGQTVRSRPAGFALTPSSVVFRGSF